MIIMKIYAISDLHLSLGVDKPMDIFGYSWQGYMERIKENWNATVKEEDMVVIPGDISWAMRLEEARNDFLFIEGLKGRKIISKGNHDYWWSGTHKMNEIFVKWGINSVSVLHNNSYETDDYVICGTRGWKHPMSTDFTDLDAKIYQREYGRLKLSFESVKAKEKPVICALHYPPFGPAGEESDFVLLMKHFNVKVCVYGHIHKNFESEYIVQGNKDGIIYHLVSSDYLKFNVRRIKSEISV